MLLLILSAAAIEPSWDCDTTASYPTLESMRGWYDALMDDPSLGLGAEFESWRDAQLDASCVPVDCAIAKDVLESMTWQLTHTCEQFACVTSAGTAIAWSLETWDDPGTYGNPSSDTTETWVVSLVGGTAVRASRTLNTAAWYHYDNLSESESLTISWDGTPIPGLPADSGFTAWTFRDSDSFFWRASSSGRWVTDGCTVYVSEETSSGDEERQVSTATADGQVRHEPMSCVNSPVGYLDGVALGVVHSTTWALSGADEDADGVEAPADCDDADATISPCAEEIEADGIDQDCDGADG